MVPRLRLSALMSLALAALLAANGCGRPVLPGGARTGALEAAGRSPALTDDEAALLRAGLLPKAYPALAAEMATGGLEAARALYRRGKPGPFSDDFGDPRAMLTAARFARDHADYARLIRGLQRGDMWVTTHNHDDDFIEEVTGGPFNHVLICVDPAVPGQFIEAIGVTAGPGDTTADQVRWASGARYAEPDATVRVLRPAHLAGAREATAIDKAIAFSLAQLGKPYNFSFSDQDGGDKAYYCSSLAYRAFQAGGIDWKLEKTPARDRLLLGLEHVVRALDPDDPVALSGATMRFLHRAPAPSTAEFAHFVVYELLPHARRTAGLVTTPEEKDHLAGAIARVLDGQAFPGFEAAAAAYKAAAAAGAFDKPGGGAKKAAMEARMAEALARDAAVLVKTSDIDTWHALVALRVVLGATLPYADAIAALFTGPHSKATKAASTFLDVLDRLHGLGLTTRWPRPGFGLADLPHRAPWVVNPDFVSPSDLAWAGLPHEDYNVLPGQPMDPPWSHAIVPADGHFTLPPP